MIKAGIPVSLTGQFASQGRQALAGLTRVGGVCQRGRRVGPGCGQSHPVSLVHYDDGSLAEGAQQATERLIKQDQVDLLFGPYSAGLTTAAAEVAESQGKLLWNHGGAGDALYARGYGNVIGILTPADQYLVGAPALARQSNPDASKLVILRIDTGAFALASSLAAWSQPTTLWGSPLSWTCATVPRKPALPRLPAPWPELEPDLVVCVGRIRHDIATARALASLPNRSSIGLAVVIAAPIAEFANQLGQQADGFIVAQPVGAGAVSVAQPDAGPDAGEALRILAMASVGVGPGGGLPHGPGLRRRLDCPTLRSRGRQRGE